MEDKVGEVTLNAAQSNKEVEIEIDRVREMETVRIKSNVSLKWVPKKRTEWTGARQYWKDHREFPELIAQMTPQYRENTVSSDRNLQRSTPVHIILRLQNSKDRKILRATGVKLHITCKDQ